MGHGYDHFAVCYEWENGVKTYAYTRQQAGCSNNVEDYVMGTKGSAKILRHSVEVGGEEVFRYRGPKPSMYDVEHKELFAAIRSGDTINNGDYMCKSTLMAILGREVCYTGQTITWDQMLNSEITRPQMFISGGMWRCRKLQFQVRLSCLGISSIDKVTKRPCSRCQDGAFVLLALV